MAAIETAHSPTPRLHPAGPPIRLPQRVRRTVLVVHIMSAGAWIGVDVLVAVLVGVGWFSDDNGTRGLAYQALGTFVVWPMLVSGLVCLVSGVVLGLGTKWGLTRYWWVFAKLAMNIGLCAVILLVLRPGMPEVVDAGQSIAADGRTDTELAGLFFPPAVSLTLLSLATWLSVFKPWGRRTRSRR